MIEIIFSDGLCWCCERWFFFFETKEFPSCVTSHLEMEKKKGSDLSWKLNWSEKLPTSWSERTKWRFILVNSAGSRFAAETWFISRRRRCRRKFCVRRLKDSYKHLYSEVNSEIYYILRDKLQREEKLSFSRKGFPWNVTFWSRAYSL